MAKESPKTREFEAFEANIEYARNMILAGKSLAPFESPIIDVRDFYRAAWVQAVSAIDHWFHEELYRRVAELTAEDGPEMPYQLTRFELPLEKVELVRRGTITLAEAVSEHVRAKWSYAALQNTAKISEAMKLVSTVDIWASAAAKLNEWHRNRTAMTAKTLKDKFGEITKRRNKIAHEADLMDGHSKRRQPISDGEATDAVAWIERIALAIANVLG